VGVAGEVALAAVRGACMNVLINLPGIKDKRFTDREKKQVDELIAKAQKLEQNIFRQTIKIIEN
jgi:formiminotetrahydrofolate cyclodeaminase